MFVVCSRVDSGRHELKSKSIQIIDSHSSFSPQPAAACVCVYRQTIRMTVSLLVADICSYRHVCCVQKDDQLNWQVTRDSVGDVSFLFLEICIDLFGRYLRRQTLWQLSFVPIGCLLVLFVSTPGQQNCCRNIGPWQVDSYQGIKPLDLSTFTNPDGFWRWTKKSLFKRLHTYFYTSFYIWQPELYGHNSKVGFRLDITISSLLIIH